MTRKEACFYLGIREDASDEQIKRAYRYKVKLYHPDANPDSDTKEHYLKVQKAYEYLMSHPYSPAQAVKNNHSMQYGSKSYQAGSMMYAHADMAKNMHAYANAAMYGQQYANPSSARPAKVYASTADAKASYQRQKDKEREREKLQKWDEEYKTNKKHQQQTQLYGKQYADRMSGTAKSKEDEALEKIRAIWLAETIKRQIALDKEQKEALQRRKLYQAFMQQKLQEDDRSN
ncbi:MAG: DnaJ domain-containing protein [Lachnospiraceae bacterium]|nr:DnaJ domain-containing protein [Lachnospiraceae bacterium]MBO5146250.1 DnaJ domain-containing protein [Lachnospiraceae bacterium]